MGAFSLSGSNGSSKQIMTQGEKILFEQVKFLRENGINSPQDAARFMLNVFETDRDNITSGFQSLREDMLDAQISAIETAAGAFNRNHFNEEERRDDLKAAFRILEPEIRTLIKKSQRYVSKVMEIDNTPRKKRFTSVFHQLSKQVDEYSYCARVSLEGVITGMTYARLIDGELGGIYIGPVNDTFNQFVTWLLQGNRCLTMSEYALNKELEGFWLEIPQASYDIINSGDWKRFTVIAPPKINPCPVVQATNPQVYVNGTKHSFLWRIFNSIISFFRRIFGNIGGRSKGRENMLVANETGQSETTFETDSETSDYENIIF